MRFFLIVMLWYLPLLVTGCTSADVQANYPSERRGPDPYTKPDGVFGPGGLRLFGGGDKAPAGSGIGVNAYLWRASLDTVSFMPVANADPFGGTILTDWYNPPNSPNERFKVNVFILDKQLRADSVRVSMFRQVRDTPGSAWHDADIIETAPRLMEDTILSRARELKVAQELTQVN